MSEIRIRQSYAHRYGEGKAHAVTYREGQWLPICTGKHIHAAEAMRVKRTELRDKVTCKKCLGSLGGAS